MKPKKRIIDYITWPYGNDQYKISVTYILDCGNLISDIRRKYTQQIICDYDKMLELEEKFNKSKATLKTKLINQLHLIGANEFVARTTMENLLQH